MHIELHQQIATVQIVLQVSKDEEELAKKRLDVKRGLPLQDLTGKRGFPEDPRLAANQKLQAEVMTKLLQRNVLHISATSFACNSCCGTTVLCLWHKWQHVVSTEVLCMQSQMLDEQAARAREARLARQAAQQQQQQ